MDVLALITWPTLLITAELDATRLQYIKLVKIWKININLRKLMQVEGYANVWHL